MSFPHRTGQRKLMETAAIGTQGSATKGIPHWENCPWHSWVELEPIRESRPTWRILQAWLRAEATGKQAEDVREAG